MKHGAPDEIVRLNPAIFTAALDDWKESQDSTELI